MTGLVATAPTWDAVAVIAPVSVLAHQGGWDELLFVLVPIALFAGLLAIANRRAVRAQAEHQQRGKPDGD